MALLVARPGLVLPALRPLTVSAQLRLELDELMEEVDPKGATEAVEGPTTDAAVEGLADLKLPWPPPAPAVVAGVACLFLFRWRAEAAAAAELDPPAEDTCLAPRPGLDLVVEIELVVADLERGGLWEKKRSR